MQGGRVSVDSSVRKMLFEKALNGKSLREFCQENNFAYSSAKDYKNGKLTFPCSFFQKIVSLAGIDANSLCYKTFPDNWWTSNAGKKGAAGLLRNYDENLLNYWRSLGWLKSALAGNIGLLKKILIPKTVDEKLSELFGAYMGDGTLTNYFIRITGDKRFDSPYFEYLSGLVVEIFGFKPTIRAEKIKNQLNLEIRSKLVCDYFKDCFHVKPGDKIRNKTIIPHFIMRDKKLFFACLRGLIDTDGSVSKDGGILSIRFTNHNQALLEQIKQNEFIRDIFTIKRNSSQAGTRNFNNIKRYFSIIGSSNLRHIVRYREYVNGNLMAKSDVVNYYVKYSESVLPFKV